MTELHNILGGDRITSRQVDELIGISRGLAADGILNQAEVEFLQKWLAANSVISDQPLIRTLYQRVNEVLTDGHADEDERGALLGTLNDFADGNYELGEVMTSSSLPLCDPAPELDIEGVLHCFTGTFKLGQRKECEKRVAERGGHFGGLTRSTEVLVVGAYATESWKHSTFGNKILKAADWRDQGHPISIVAESHWVTYL